MDLEFKGNAFTWTNNQVGEACIQERIDRAMANLEWRLKFPHAQVFHEVILGFDHCPLILNCDVPLQKVPKLFKFESMWITHPNCENVIDEAWNLPVYGSDMFKLVQRLKNCRRKLCIWSKDEFGNNKVKLELLKDRLACLQSCDSLEVYHSQQKQVKHEIEVLLAREEMFYHQRSRIRWLSYGDRNTCFFHASMIQRRQRNQLLKIKSEGGSWLTTEHEINSELRDFFQSLFHSAGSNEMEEALSVINPIITPSMNTSLIRPVSSAEIDLAVFQLGVLKAPGPDGYPGLFYQRYWEKVKNATISAVKHFFESGFLLKEFNYTNLVLIPKLPAPELLSHFRPISLCNFCLKIITKILANRLKTILDRVVTPHQFAFIPGRLIQDSIIVAHEAFHHPKINRRGSKFDMAISLDFNKAYDRVEWNFLEAVLRRMGFHDTWVHWVMQTVTTVKFSVFANGAKRANVTPSRGLRQGDPLSPYLFLLVIDVLSKLLIQGVSGNLFTGIKLGTHCPTISHLFFADDAIVFAKASKEECGQLLKILDVYNKASGQIINFNKSGVSFSSNTPAGLQQEISDLLQMAHVSKKVRYLGLPAFWGKSKMEAYSFLLEKTISKLQGWKKVTLNQAGKEILIKSVVQAIPSYAMACFALPKKFCDKLNS